jgi:hypothetical protein
MAPFEGGELGRAAGKFQGLINSLKELPNTSLESQDLLELLTDMHNSFDPYSSHFANEKTQPSRSPAHPSEPDIGESTVTVNLPSAKPVIASRVKWKNPPSFEAADYLDPLVKEAFLDPEVLRTPISMWPPAKPAKMHITKSEMLKMISVWDALGACSICPLSEKDYTEAVGIFAVDKDLDYDRLIINPKTINSRMSSISYSTKELAPGSMLTLLHLKPGEMFRFNADDLSDYYYCFKVSPARARRNAFRMVFDSTELSHLSCFHPSFHGKKLLICLATLAMGDSLAVEIAQQAHANVLKVWCGAMIPDECLRYRSPIPRSDFIELLAIDDHVGIQRLSIRDFPKTHKLRDSEVFDLAGRAYSAVGLIQHEQKRKRNQVEGTILGADFDGLKGRVMAPRGRVILLCAISLQIVKRGSCTRRLLSVLLGCWIHVILFRRVVFSVIDQLFREGQDLPMDRVFVLSPQARCELQILAVLGPVCQSDIRAKHSTRIFSTDASPSGGAVIAADIGSTASGEIWRHCEQRGFYTRLQSPVSEILQEKGYEPCSNEAFISAASVPTPAVMHVPAPMTEGILYDCIEIFRGTGNWSEAHSQHGFRVHDGIDISGRRLRFTDMADPSTFHELKALALRRVCLDWHAGVPCVGFGTLRRPQVRSKQYPAGFNMSDPFTAFHNMLARRTAFLLTLVLLSGHFVSVEQPGSSRMFLLHCFRVMVLLGCTISHFCFCNFGTPFMKPSKWLHNKPWLLSMEGPCNCGKKGNHFIVQGSFTNQSIKDFCTLCRPSCESVFGKTPRVGQPVSQFSGAYPKRLVEHMASGLSLALKGSAGSIPLQHRLASLREVGFSDEDLVPSPNTEPPFANRAWFEGPEWITELCDCLPFKELFRYRFKRSGHINVNEMRTYKSFLKSCAKSEADSRVVALLDSRVTIGAAAKGRSSSAALSRVLRSSLAYVLGANLYPGLLHCASEVNRTDGPSRDKPVAPPTKDEPSWLTDLKMGKTRKFDAVVESSRIPKNPARWLRFLLMLCGDIEPNPGPRRGPMNLQIGFVKATSTRMAKCFEAFQTWCSERLEIDSDVVCSDMQVLAWALRAYGMYLFEAGLPRYLLVYAITASQDLFPACKPWLNLAWQIDRKWQLHEPGSCRAVLPAVIVKAMACLAGLWNWKCWTGVFLLGFAGMLHPSEMLALTRKDLVFPRDLNYDQPALYLRVRDPKTARFARQQHSRVDDAGIISIAESVFGSLPLSEKLYPGSINTFRRQWNCIMDALGVPCKQRDNGATPGVLRGSGATYFYTSTEDLSWVAWRGRWSRVKTLEFYLQEVGSHMLIHELDNWAKAKIFPLADAAPAVLWRVFDLAVQ